MASIIRGAAFARVAHQAPRRHVTRTARPVLSSLPLSSTATSDPLRSLGGAPSGRVVSPLLYKAWRSCEGLATAVGLTVAAIGFATTVGDGSAGTEGEAGWSRRSSSESTYYFGGSTRTSFGQRDGSGSTCINEADDKFFGPDYEYVMVRDSYRLCFPPLSSFRETRP